MQPRHDQHIGGTRQATERIIGGQHWVERDIWRHFAFIFKADTATVEDRNRVADWRQPAARGIAEGRVRQERHARLMPHPPRDACGLLGDIGELFGRRAFVDRGIGHKDGVMLADEHMNAKGGAPDRRIEHTTDFAHRLRKGPRRAGDHAIGLAEAEQQRAKNIAIIIDHPLAVAAQIAVPLEPCIKQIDHRRHERRDAAVVQFIALGIINAERLELIAHAIATDQHRRAAAPLTERDCGAQHNFVLGFGKHHPLGMCARIVIRRRQHRGCRVEPRAQRQAIAVHVEDRLGRYARIHRCLCDCCRHNFHQPRIERRGNDIINAKACLQPAISGRDFLGHLLARKLGDRARGRDLHFLVDRRRADIERAAEDEGETKDIIDLIGIVRTPRGNDAIGAHRLGIGRRDFGIGVRHRKDDRLRRHLADHLGAERALDRQAEENIGAIERFFERTRVGDRGMRRFPLVNAFAPLPDHTLGIAHDDIAGVDPHRLDQRGAGDRRGARTIDDNLDFGKLAPADFACVDQPRCRNNRGAMLIVMHHRNLHPLLERLFDDEAFGRLDIFKVDPAKARFEQCDGVDKGFGILSIDFKVDRINIGKALKQHRLAFHHRL